MGDIGVRRKVVGRRIEGSGGAYSLVTDVLECGHERVRTVAWGGLGHRTPAEVRCEACAREAVRALLRDADDCAALGADVDPATLADEIAEAVAAEVGGTAEDYRPAVVREIERLDAEDAEAREREPYRIRSAGRIA